MNFRGQNPQPDTVNLDTGSSFNGFHQQKTDVEYEADARRRSKRRLTLTGTGLIGLVLFLIAAGMGIRSWMYQPVQAIGRDGQPVENVYQFSTTPLLYDLRTNGFVQEWMRRHLSPLGSVEVGDIQRGWFAAAVYDALEPVHNVTLDGLERAMNSSCTDPDICTCVSALELGVAKNVVYFRQPEPLFMYEPSIEARSDRVEHVRIEWRQKQLPKNELRDIYSWEAVPTWLTVKYRVSPGSGGFDRGTLDLAQAACLLGNLRLLGRE